MSDATDNRFYREKTTQAKADDLVERRLGPIASRCSREDDRLTIIAACNELSSIRAQLAAAEASERDATGVANRLLDRAISAEAQLSSARKALEECLGHMGWRNYTDEEMQHEAELGNGMAPIILRAREVIRSLHSNGE